MRTVVDLSVAATAACAAAAIIDLGCRRRTDRAAIAGLQRALTNALPLLSSVSYGAAVLSASPGVDVGGDIVDVFELDSRFAMLLVADVSGKGVEAAAQTGFIKYTIRTLALENDGDPAVVLAKFNAMYYRTATDHESFVVLILGIIDSQTGDLRYASAGHEPAFVRRRNGSIAMLAPTGPIVGAAPYSAYRTDTIALDRGDVVVWTTDGVTESRDRERRLLGVDGLADWIAGAPHDVAEIADWVIAALRRRSGSVESDDVAVLAVGYDPALPHPAQRVRTPAFAALPAALRRGRTGGQRAF